MFKQQISYIIVTPIFLTLDKEILLLYSTNTKLVLDMLYVLVLKAHRVCVQFRDNYYFYKFTNFIFAQINFKRIFH